MTHTATIQDRLSALILAAPDVATLYSAQPAVLEIATQGVSAITSGDSRPRNVLVSETPAGTSVTVSVGVTGEHSAAGVCRDLHDTIAAELTAAGASLPLSVDVKIASIA